MSYENPLMDLDTLPSTTPEGVKGSKQADLIPKGKYTCVLVDFSAEAAQGGPAKGMTRIRTTWDVDVDDRKRKHFIDLVPSPTAVTWDNGGELRDYTLANQLAEVLGLVGKPYGDVIRAAQQTSVTHAIDIDKKTDRNITRKITA